MNNIQISVLIEDIDDIEFNLKEKVFIIWKKSTTYTMLRRLCERSIFQNKDGIVSSLLSKQEVVALQSEQFIEDNFSGSLPKFLAAFITRKKLSEKEINELQTLINQQKR